MLNTFYLLTILITFSILLPISTAFFGVDDTVSKQVHHWLHWGANLHHSSEAFPAPHPRAPSSSLSTETSIESIPSWVLGAGTVNRTNVIDYASQMMHRPEIDLIASYLRPDDIYLEYGSGGSTLNFAPMVGRAYSIEHNCEWASFLSGAIAKQYQHVTIKCVPVRPGFRGWGTLSNFEHGNYQQFREYVDAVELLPDNSFDKVFIDGRARLACALKVLPFLKDDGLVFIHDFYARLDHYSGALPYYKEVARVLATSNTDESLGPLEEPQGLIVLRRSPNASYPVPPSEIDKLYEGINWRYPFGPPLTSLRGYLALGMRKISDCGCYPRAYSPAHMVMLVRRDLLHGAMLYAVVMLLLRQWERLKSQRKSTTGSVTAAGDSTGIQQDRAEQGRNVSKQRQATNGVNVSVSIQPGESANARPEPRFVETEGMRIAKARRKRAQSESSVRKAE